MHSDLYLSHFRGIGSCVRIRHRIPDNRHSRGSSDSMRPEEILPGDPSSVLKYKFQKFTNVLSSQSFENSRNIFVYLQTFANDCERSWTFEIFSREHYLLYTIVYWDVHISVFSNTVYKTLLLIEFILDCFKSDYDLVVLIRPLHQRWDPFIYSRFEV